MSRKNFGNSLETQRMLDLQYVRSGLEYASSRWSPWISNSSIQRVQNSALRSIAGLSKTCLQDFLHLETGIEPIQGRFQKNYMITWDNYARLTPEDSRRLIEKEVPPRLKTRQGWRHKTAKLMTRFDYKRAPKGKIASPWKQVKINLEAVELEKKKLEYTKDELNRRAIEKITELRKDVEIYMVPPVADKRKGEQAYS